MKYKNPLTAINHESDHYGDPFVFRYHGRYYLFVSTPDGSQTIRCYISNDLVEWTFLTNAAEEPLLEAAYAPEIIYAYNRFYLVTSPKGNGHYIYVSDKPEGPYKRLTDNINSMIDGSFFVSSDGTLHLLRADHNGIALLDVSYEGKLSHRRNLGTYLQAWTEGPSMFYRNGYYYLTYCGNHLLSKGYRIAYATSKRFDRDFIAATNNPLLINTHHGYTRLGHSSSVLGPDLDSFYIVYHTMEATKGGFLPRKFMIDRLRFNGRMLYTASSSFFIEKPLRPTYETFNPRQDMITIGNHRLSPFATASSYTLETSFKGRDISLILGYQDEQHYYELRFIDGEIIFNKLDNQIQTIKKITCKFDFASFHTVRLIVSNQSELIIDNAPIATLEKIAAGRIGFSLDGEYSYTAFSNYANGSSNTSYPNVLPGLISVTDGMKPSDKSFDNNDELYYKSLVDESFEYVAPYQGHYGLHIHAHVFEPSLIEVNGRPITIQPVSSEYAYLSYFLGFIELKQSGTIHLKLISGKLYFKFITIDAIIPYAYKNNFAIVDKNLLTNKDKDSYLLESIVGGAYDVSVEFCIDTLKPYDIFGILLATRQYSNEYPQARFPLIGYLVGFEGSLLIIEALNYGRSRIYDRPTNIKQGQTYTLRATLNNGVFRIYIDHQIMIETSIDTPAHLGGYGLYASIDSSVKLSNLISNEERR